MEKRERWSVWPIARLCEELKVAYGRRARNAPGGVYAVQRALESLKAEEEGRYRRLQNLMPDLRAQVRAFARSA